MGRNAIDKKWWYLYNEHIIDKKMDKIGKHIPEWHRTVRESLRVDSVAQLRKEGFYMKWMNKLERKFGKYAIQNLMTYIIGLYCLGFVINMVNPMIYYQYLALDASQIFRGQVWRLVTFIKIGRAHV